MSELEKKNNAAPRGLKDDEMAAVVVAGSIVAFFAVYWFFENLIGERTVRNGVWLALGLRASRVRVTREARLALGYCIGE